VGGFSGSVGEKAGRWGLLILWETGILMVKRGRVIEKTKRRRKRYRGKKIGLLIRKGKLKKK